MIHDAWVVIVATHELLIFAAACTFFALWMDARHERDDAEARCKSALRRLDKAEEWIRAPRGSSRAILDALNSGYVVPAQRRSSGGVL